MNTEFAFVIRNIEPICSDEAIKALKFPLRDCCAYLTSSKDEIAARQRIFRDLLGDDGFFAAFEEACRHLSDMAELAKNLGDNSVDSSEDLLYALVELLTFTDTVDAFDEAYAAAEKLTSERLLEFFRTIRDITEDEEYRALKEWLYSLHAGLRSIRSLTLGVNLDAQLGISEVGIVSINDKPYVCGNFVEKAMRNETPPDEFTCMTVVGIREVGNFLGRNKIVVNSEFYNSMNVIYKSALKSLRKKLSENVQQTVRSLMSLRDDFDFLLRAAANIKYLKERGMAVTFPEIADETVIEKLSNPLLLEKCRAKQIVASDVSFTEAEKIYLLTGPNSGGKSVYTAAVGIAQLYFQLGLPICAAGRPKMKPYRRIVTHFIEETRRDTESRLANESQRLNETLKGIGESTLLLLDETFSSTSAYDALYLAETLTKYLAKIGCNVVYVTHLHELPERLKDVRTVRRISPEMIDGKRTYRIIPFEGDEKTSSLAKDIVIENGLGFLFE